MSNECLVDRVKSIKALALKMVHHAKASHIGGSLSMVEILAILYFEKMKVDPLNPKWANRDRLFLSKGHCCTSLYACLALKGFFPIEELDQYGEDGTRLQAHASHHVPGVEFSTGSLGHALPFAAGTALAAKRQSMSWHVFTILSDGELDEGSNWEAILFAGHHKLKNLTVIVDNNKIQSLGKTCDVLSLEPLEEKFRSFHWDVERIDGHDLDELRKSLDCNSTSERDVPKMIIADTTKGKGVDFMENRLDWHYKSPDDAELHSALGQLSS